MKGSNTLTLNPATMREAVQYYLDECVFMTDTGVEVMSVSASDCSSTATFKVLLSELKVEVKK